MRINHNLPALNTYRQLTSNQANAVKSTEKLSSGLRINRAGDDAAGLAISEKMRGQIRGLDQASRNSQDAISMIQTAEGGLNEVHDILQRMRELAVQAGTDTNTESDRGEIQKEINQLTSEINRIGNTTEFNTQKLLNGDKSNTALSSTGRGLVNASGVVGAANGTIAAGAGSLSLVQNGSGKLAEGDYKVVITSSVSSGTLASGTTTTTVNAGSVAGTGTYSPKLADVTISGAAPSFSGDGIKFDRTVLDIDSGATADFSLTKLSGGGYQLSFTTSGAAGTSGVTITDVIYADADGNFSYDNYGISFAGSGLASLATGDSLTYTLPAASGTTTAGTKQTFWSSVNVSGGTADSPNLGTLSLSGVAQGDYKVTIDVDAAGGSGTITITALNASGGTEVLGSFSGVAFTTSGADFTYDAHGISFTLSGLDNFATSSSNTLEFSTWTTTTTTPDTYTDTVTYSASLQNASGVELASGTVGTSTTITASGTATSSGLTADFSGDIGGVHLNFAASTSGGGIVGTTDVKVGAIIEEVAKSGDSSLTFQIGANENQSMSLEISDMRSNALGITRSADAGSHAGFTSDQVVNNGTNNTSTEYALDVSTAKNAANAVTVIQSAIDKVSSERSKLGAYQNRLEHTINNLGTSSENLTASESRIRDVDMAKEMMANTRNNILQQAAQAMLAQANQAPQQVLQLLR